MRMHVLRKSHTLLAPRRTQAKYGQRRHQRTWFYNSIVLQVVPWHQNSTWSAMRSAWLAAPGDDHNLVNTSSSYCILFPGYLPRQQLFFKAYPVELPNLADLKQYTDEGIKYSKHTVLRGNE